MRLLFCVTIIVIFGFYSCNYSKEVKKESAKIFDSHKKFMTEMSFMGVVYEKNICEKCKINRYTLKIGLTQFNQKPKFADTHYSPYYFFENDSTLNVSVDVKLFNGVEIKDTVKKEAKSFTFKVLHKEEMQYLSNEELKWLPE